MVGVAVPVAVRVQVYVACCVTVRLTVKVGVIVIVAVNDGVMVGVFVVAELYQTSFCTIGLSVTPLMSHIFPLYTVHAMDSRPEKAALMVALFQVTPSADHHTSFVRAEFPNPPITHILLS
jgi:hypothetical protein